LGESGRGSTSLTHLDLLKSGFTTGQIVAIDGGALIV
jgi:hypothetical protein